MHCLSNLAIVSSRICLKFPFHTKLTQMTCSHHTYGPIPENQWPRLGSYCSSTGKEFDLNVASLELWGSTLLVHFHHQLVIAMPVMSVIFLLDWKETVQIFCTYQKSSKERTEALNFNTIYCMTSNPDKDFQKRAQTPAACRHHECGLGSWPSAPFQPEIMPQTQTQNHDPDMSRTFQEV